MDMIRLFQGDDTGGAFGRVVTVKLDFEGIDPETLATSSAVLTLCGIKKCLPAPLVNGENTPI